MAKLSMRIIKNRAPQKINMLQRRVARKATKASKELAELGKQYAIFKAPYDTGRLVSLITTRKGQGDVKWKVVAIDPVPNAPKSYRGLDSPPANFKLVRWMHTSAKARHHIRTGSPTFMYDATDYLNKIKKTKIRKGFKNINLR